MILPESWRLVTIAQLAKTIQQGFAQRPNLNQQGIPQIRTNNVMPDGRIDLADLDYVFLPERSAERYLLSNGDIMFNNTNSPVLVGKTALFQADGQYTFSNHMTRIRVEPTLATPEYLAKYLQFLFLQRRFEGIAKVWVSQAAIDIPTLSSLTIPLPPLEEQERIVEKLQLAETIREQQRQVTEKAKGLILRLFEEMFLYNPERDEWPVVTVGEAGTIQLGRQRSPQYQTGRYMKPYLRVANVFEDKIDVSDILEMDFDFQDRNKYKLEAGDVLITEGGIAGRPAIWTGQLDECYYDKHLLRFRPNPSIESEYAFAYFLHQYKSGFYERNTNKSSGIAFIGIGNFVKYPFLMSPHALQRSFARRVKAIRDITSTTQAKEARMDNVLGVLTAQAFNGTLTVKWRETNLDDFTQPVLENAIITTSDEENPDTLKADLNSGLRDRVLFWKDVPTESRLHVVYNIFSSQIYYNAQTIVERLNQLNHALTEYEVTIALDTLIAAGLILPVILEMPDPANPSGAGVCINAYCLLNEGDNGQKDFQTSTYTLIDTVEANEAFTSEAQ